MLLSLVILEGSGHKNSLSLPEHSTFHQLQRAFVAKTGKEIDGFTHYGERTLPNAQLCDCVEDGDLLLVHLRETGGAKFACVDMTRGGITGKCVEYNGLENYSVSPGYFIGCVHPNVDDNGDAYFIFDKNQEKKFVKKKKKQQRCIRPDGELCKAVGQKYSLQPHTDSFKLQPDADDLKTAKKFAVNDTEMWQNLECKDCGVPMSHWGTRRIREIFFYDCEYRIQYVLHQDELEDDDQQGVVVTVTGCTAKGDYRKFGDGEHFKHYETFQIHVWKMGDDWTCECGQTTSVDQKTCSSSTCSKEREFERTEYEGGDEEEPKLKQSGDSSIKSSEMQVIIILAETSLNQYKEVLFEKGYKDVDAIAYVKSDKLEALGIKEGEVAKLKSAASIYAK